MDTDYFDTEEKRLNLIVISQDLKSVFQCVFHSWWFKSIFFHISVNKPNILFLGFSFRIRSGPLIYVVLDLIDLIPV